MKHPAIRELFQTLTRNAAFQDLVGQILRRETHRLSLSGLTTTAKAAYLVLLWQATERPLVVVVDGNKQADLLMELVQTFFDLLIDRPDRPEPQIIPAYDILPHQRLSPHSEIVEQRAIGLWRLATQKVPLTIAPIGSALLRTDTPEFYRQL
ncbi:MAG TPA: transcription-repair coupling factor, partial [Candidatus Methylomirabilis sp.]|nr:transcription-repair coupling factor [Candidatus Methylomirabilis sp.]